MSEHWLTETPISKREGAIRYHQRLKYLSNQPRIASIGMSFIKKTGSWVLETDDDSDPQAAYQMIQDSIEDIFKKEYWSRVWIIQELALSRRTTLACGDKEVPRTSRIRFGTAKQKYDPRHRNLPLQPDSRPISQEQVASEVKSIYAGLKMVEKKCIHVDHTSADTVEGNVMKLELSTAYWQALVALYQSLLHEHHDFLLASQHPSTLIELKRLAAEHSMPAQMWKHGIHSFLEIFRRRFPDNVNHMLDFIYSAYHMMAMLYKNVAAFKEAWIEGLGDLRRNRMTIEDESVRHRQTWAGAACSWYTNAADKFSIVGRLYHHIAILARPNAMQQLYYYTSSLTCVNPFPSAWEYPTDRRRFSRASLRRLWILNQLESAARCKIKFAEISSARPTTTDLVPEHVVPDLWSYRHRIGATANASVSEHVVPGMLNSQHRIEATADTGARYNFLNEDYTRRCRFRIDRTTRKHILVASGHKVRTAGTVEIPFSFRDDATTHSVLFHVLPGCIKNVILGRSFLRATKTLSNALNFTKRVVKRFASAVSMRHVLLLGTSAPMFTGTLNGRSQNALADSGSKVLIMDEDYARKMGFSIFRTKDTRIRLRFADGSTATTSGKTYGVDWKFGASGRGKAFSLDFYVLKNAPADVILSEDFLFRETKAFIEYDAYLIDEDVDEETYDDDDYLFAIDRDEDFEPQTNWQGADQYFEDDREYLRREAEDRHIATLVGTEKDDAIAIAEERRNRWKSAQAISSSAQGSQNNSAQHSGALPPVQPPPAQSPPAQPFPAQSLPVQPLPNTTLATLPRLKKRRWLFFLKKKSP